MTTAIVNFATLKTELLALSKRQDLATRAGEFVARAEEMIGNAVRSTELLTTATLDDSKRLVALGPVYSLPAACSDVAKIYDGTNPPFTRRSLEALQRFQFSDTTHSYAVSGNGTPAGTVEFRGTPGAGWTATLLYWQKPTPLANDGDAGPLLLANPSVYLHAALHWIAIDGRDFAGADAYKTLFDERVEKLNRQCKRALSSGSTFNLVTINHGSSY